MKLQSIIIERYERPALVLSVGDKIILRTVHGRSYTSYEWPDKLEVATVEKICGGASKQWVRLNNGVEYDTRGRKRGTEPYAHFPSIEAYSDEAVAEAVRLQRQHDARLALDKRVDAVKWPSVICDDELASKLRDFLDAVDAKLKKA